MEGTVKQIYVLGEKCDTKISFLLVEIKSGSIQNWKTLWVKQKHVIYGRTTKWRERRTSKINQFFSMYVEMKTDGSCDEFTRTDSSGYR